MWAASSLLECTLYELIYLYLNNACSYRCGIRICLSLESNKPANSSKNNNNSSFPQERSHNRQHREAEKTKGAPKPQRTLSQQGENPGTKSPTPSLSGFCSLLQGRSPRGMWSGFLADVYKEFILPEQSNREKMWQACLETHTGKEHRINLFFSWFFLGGFFLYSCLEVCS